MLRSIVSTLLVVSVFALLSLSGPLAAAQDKPATSEAEYKAVLFGADEKEATRKLNELVKDGWDYVGPLGGGLVAFKRRPQGGLVERVATLERDLAELKRKSEYGIVLSGTLAIKLEDEKFEQEGHHVHTTHVALPRGMELKDTDDSPFSVLVHVRNYHSNSHGGPLYYAWVRPHKGDISGFDITLKDQSDVRHPGEVVVVDYIVVRNAPKTPK
jgi:hypothetical protein